MAQRDSRGRWLKGQSPNPDGRPKGARQELSEAFLQDVLEHWKLFGHEALIRTLITKPEAYLATVAKILPKQVEAQLDVSKLEDLLIGLASEHHAVPDSEVEEEPTEVRH